MVLTVSFALSPVIGLCCHRRKRNYFRQLDASVEASGPHDFAVRITCCSSKAPTASTASRPAFVTIASRPSKGRDGAVYSFDLGETTKGIFLQMGLDSANQIDPPGQFTLCTNSGSQASAARTYDAKGVERNILICFVGNLPRPGGVWLATGWVRKPARKSNMDANQSLDARRIARDQESRLAAAAVVGLNATKPLLEYQTSMLRLWADNCELIARNYEKSLEAFTAAIEQRREAA